MAAEREIPDHESLTVEFKSELSQRPDGSTKPRKLPDGELIDTVVALSNTEGGLLYLGVEDDGTPTGIHEEHSDVTRLPAFIANKTVPPVPARVSTLLLSRDGSANEEGVQVTRIEVPKSTAIVAASDGKIMRRRLKADGTPESAPLYPYEVITRLSTLGQLDYSAFPVPGTTMDDFDPAELRRLREILEENRNSDPTLLELPDEGVLSALQMTTVADGKVTPTVTGILIAGRRDSIARAVPTAKATFQVLEGTEVRVNQDFDQPLLYTIEKIREMIEPWNPEREFEDGLFRQSVPEFDRRAFREALVNAFGHRDYAALGRVRVLIDDEGLTIANPGGFIEGVTVNNLLTAEPHGRNECLMHALKRIGLAEKTGRGVDRIFEGSLHYGRPLPDYSGSTSANVRVFIARSAPDELFMKMLREERERTGKPLSLSSLLALDALKMQRRLTVRELAAQLHITNVVARTTLESLVEAGMVVARGNSPARSYTLSSSVYARSGKEAGFVRQADIDKIRHPELVMKLAIQQGGSVATREVESLLHLHRKQAYRLLVKLVKSGDLKLVGKGGAARYEVTDEGYNDYK
ncbi:RNA-binding domain-containing protein [Curtanaerobium respiraculi]|uniref:RNA-binding domain-containing protein n=1 Tax=Curtanaerobium respiraculi TaxID=2949669 RepID=UPI0024B32F45|nr:RNA-binding domain-containing protein [Curtanaerobium respiraculi]